MFRASSAVTGSDYFQGYVGQEGHFCSGDVLDELGGGRRALESLPVGLVDVGDQAFEAGGSVDVADEASYEQVWGRSWK